MTHLKDNPITTAMINAALAAGKAILETERKGFSIHEKEDLSPVTEADLAADSTITQILSLTDIPILTEESEKTPYETRKNFKQVFIVDPLDGTREFINKTGQWGVNIGLIEDGYPIAGVIYLPLAQKLYFGGTDIPAVRAEVSPETLLADFNDLHWTPLPDCKLPEVYTVLSSKTEPNKDMAAYFEQIEKEKNARIVQMGSCTKYCLIAEGKANEYTRYGTVMEWDTAAGHGLLKSLGYPLRSILSGEELVYNKEKLTSSDFFVKIN